MLKLNLQDRFGPELEVGVQCCLKMCARYSQIAEVQMTSRDSALTIIFSAPEVITWAEGVVQVVERLPSTRETLVQSSLLQISIQYR
jgi:hypothetical protein